MSHHLMNHKEGKETDADGKEKVDFTVPSQEIKKMLFYEIEASHLKKHTAGPPKELQ